MKHGTLFTVSLTHPFYADGRCRDFALEPSAATRRLLRNHRLVLRPSPGGLRILTPLDGKGRVFLHLAGSTEFVFHLVPVNPDFALHTDLAAIDKQSGPLFTDRGVPSGAPLRLTSWKSAPAGFGLGVLADVQVHAGGGQLVEQEFRIEFAPRQARWAYYCVTDLAVDGGQLSLVDATPANPQAPLLFSAANRRELNDEPDPEDRIARQLAERHGSLRRVRFLSDEAVACHEAPGRHLELHLDGLRLSGPLPLPSVRSYSTVATASGGVEDSLYQVFKYLTEPIT